MATPVVMPRQGQSVESCILLEWRASPNQKVEQGQTVAQIETDKAEFEVEAPVGGTLLELFFEPGDDIPVLTNIAAIGNPGEDVSSLRPPAGAAPQAATAPVESMKEEPVVVPPQTTSATAPGKRVRVSPRARRLANKQGIDIAGLVGTGPGGRVMERDVMAARTTVSASPPAAGTEVPVSGVRKLIAERMHRSLATTAQLTLTTSFDATSLEALRSKVKAQGEKLRRPKVTINDLIVYATARTLATHPRLNAHWLGDKIVQHGQVNMGIAMDTPRGLIVPVLSAANTLSVVDISRRIKRLAEAAQQGKINPDLLTGGTFTMTNMGMLGIETFTPIVNAPEVAILGVGGKNLKPVQMADGIEHIPAISLSLTIDHQAADGADGARFLNDLKGALENIELTLLG